MQGWLDCDLRELKTHILTVVTAHAVSTDRANVKVSHSRTFEPLLKVMSRDARLSLEDG